MTETLIVTKRYTAEVPEDGTQAFEDLVAQMVADQDDELHQFAMRVEAATWLDKRDLVALWMVERYHAGDFTDRVQDWDWNVQRGTR